MSDAFQLLSGSFFGQSPAPATPARFTGEGMAVRRHVLVDKVKRRHVSAAPALPPVESVRDWLTLARCGQLAAASYASAIACSQAAPGQTKDDTRQAFIAALLLDLEQRLRVQAGLSKGGVL
jgi:hypothetical protein